MNWKHRTASTVFVAAIALAGSAQAAVIFSENFDGVVAPALPSGWTTTSTVSNLWQTSTINPSSTPNDAFINDINTVSDNRLISPVISLLGSTNAVLTFANNYNLETNFDGGVLEASINGGAFADILSVGGAFLSGGYNSTISSAFSSPISGRQAWSGNSGGYITSSIDLPNSVDGANVQFRWREGTDDSVSGTGWRIDNIVLTADTAAAVPEPTTLALLALGLAGFAALRRRQLK